MKDIDINLDFIEDVNSKLKMKKIIDKIRIILKSHTLEVTDFLDPYELKIGISIIRQVQGISYLPYGGGKDSERNILYIFPDYMDFIDLDDEIAYLQIDRIEGLSHRNYLGSILALGVKRDKLGDILLYKKSVIFIVKREIKNFIIMNLSQIASNSICISEVREKPCENPIESFEEFQIFTSSLRLDNILSSIYKLSRAEILKKIKSNDVKVNWEPIKKPTRTLNEGDVISLKGFGRSKIQAYKGQSRKDKNILIVRKLKWWSDVMITPLDIQNKNFRKTLMGFSQNEVNSFLQEMIEDYEEMYKENIAYKDKILSLSEQINQYKTLEETLKTTLLLAQKSADEVTLNARNKAELIIEGAEDRGQKIVEKNKEEVKYIRDEYEFLKKELFIFKTRFSSFLQSQLSNLDEFYTEIEKNQVTEDANNKE